MTDQLTALLARIDRLTAALRKIEGWELPESGMFYPNKDGTISDRPAPYDSIFAFGTNGAQKYIRELARAALDEPTHAGKGEEGV